MIAAAFVKMEMRRSATKPGLVGILSVNLGLFGLAFRGVCFSLYYLLILSLYTMHSFAGAMLFPTLPMYNT